MNCSSSSYENDNASNEMKAELQVTLQNLQADIECTKRSMEFSKIMLSYSFDKIKSLESQVRQIKSVIGDSTSVKETFSDDEKSTGGSSTVVGRTAAESICGIFNNRDNNIVDIDSLKEEPVGNRRKKHKMTTQNTDISTQTLDNNNQQETSKAKVEQRVSEDEPFYVTDSAAIAISDDFTEIDSSEVPSRNRRKAMGRNPTSGKSFAAQNTCGNSYANLPDIELVDLGVEPSTSFATNSSGEVDDTDTEAARMAVHRTQGILPSKQLLTFLLLSRQVDDPLQLVTAFTKDMKLFYLQLVNFAFHLQDINRTLEQHGNSSVDRRLEERLQILIDVFEAELNEQFADHCL